MGARPYHLLDVFTDRPFGGNPLAVFLDGRGLSGATMQSIAGELNLSETTFVLPPERGGDARVRIFTPRRELPFAGHPTVGTAWAIASERDPAPSKLVLEEGVGDVAVSLRFFDGALTGATLTAARAPETRPAPPLEDVAAVVGLESSDLLDERLSPAFVSVGMPFLFVPVRDREVLGRCRLQPGPWESVLEDAWCREVYLFTPDAETDGHDYRARLYAPAAGIAEDPATGSAAAALAGYLAEREEEPDGDFRWLLEQGMEMGRPSFLELEAEKRGGAVTAIRVGGGVVRIGGGALDLD